MQVLKIDCKPTFRKRASEPLSKYARLQPPCREPFRAAHTGLLHLRNGRLKARMGELEGQKAGIIARQLEAPADTPDVHPNIGNIYRKRVEWFADALHNDDDGRIAAEELRSLIEEVVLMPGEKRGEVHAKLRGELFGILDFVEAEHRQRPGEVRTKVEASPRNQIDKKTPVNSMSYWGFVLSEFFCSNEIKDLGRRFKSEGPVPLNHLWFLEGRQGGGKSVQQRPSHLRSMKKVGSGGKVSTAEQFQASAAE